MCTATYLPLGTNDFILTHSRDEKAIRPAALPPRTVRVDGIDVTFPQDPQGQGTWIASGLRFGTTRTTVCLLNGAFTPHLSKPPYRHSRGLVPVHVFTYPTIKSFITTYDFSNIEPLTLLIAEANRLIELRWNGNRLFIREKNPKQPFIWSSATLYSIDIIRQREGWFWDWYRQNPTPSVDAIRRFHQVAGKDDAENGLRMNRQNFMLTVSLTSVVHHQEDVTMLYEDFTQSIVSQQTINPSYATA
jgi:hypothetical protein